MLDTIWAYILFHPTIPFKSILSDEGNFGEYGQIYVAIKISAYLCAYGYLCGKIFKYLNGAIKEKKKEEMTTYFLLKYFEFAQFYLVLGFILGIILLIIAFLGFI
jgi:hypothetical protein